MFITESLINKKNEFYKNEENKIEKKITEIKDYYNENIKNIENNNNAKKSKNFESKLNLLIEIYNKYFFYEKNEIEKFKKIKENLEKINLKDLKKLINENYEYFENKMKTNNFNLLLKEKDSNFFNILFKINKNDPNLTIKDSQNEYNEFEKIFEKIPNIPFEILNKLEIHYINDKEDFFKEIDNEISILKNIFGINEYKPYLNENKKLFFIRLKKDFFIKQIDNIINFFKEYSNNESDKNNFDELEKIKEKIKEKDLTLEKVNQIYEKIDKIYYLFKSYLYDSKNAIILEEIFKNKENFEFLSNKTNDEIRKLNEFIDETEESYIDINLFNALLKCVNFLNKLKNLKKKDNKLSFVGLNNEYENLLKKDEFKEIEKIFKKINENFNYIKEFYLNILDKNNLNIIKINKINENGIIVIDYDKIYKCECKLNNKKILTLEKINELKETLQFNLDDNDKEKK